jgi:hypothetical protein
LIKRFEKRLSSNREAEFLSPRNTGTMCKV